LEDERPRNVKDLFKVFPKKVREKIGKSSLESNSSRPSKSENKVTGPAKRTKNTDI